MINGTTEGHSPFTYIRFPTATTMIGTMIPNPKRNAVVDFTLTEAKMALERVPAHFQNKFTITERNPVMNHYTFSTFEFLSLGAYVEVSLNAISDTKTDIVVEVRRKVGAFDKSYEVSNANQHIANLFTALSTLLVNAREGVKANAVEVDVPNPTMVAKYRHSWDEVKRHIDTMVQQYPGTYMKVADKGDQVILHRKPQAADDVVLDRTCVLKISHVGSADGVIDVNIESTNDQGKILTHGELSRNKLIMTITNTLLERTFPDMVAAAKAAQPKQKLDGYAMAAIVFVVVAIGVVAYFFLKKG